MESFTAVDFLALALQHVPEPRLHQVRDYGRCSNASRARRAVSEGAHVPAIAPGDGVMPADPAQDEPVRPNAVGCDGCGPGFFATSTRSTR